MPFMVTNIYNWRAHPVTPFWERIFSFLIRFLAYGMLCVSVYGQT